MLWRYKPAVRTLDRVASRAGSMSRISPANDPPSQRRRVALCMMRFRSDRLRKDRELVPGSKWNRDVCRELFGWRIQASAIADFDLSPRFPRSRRGHLLDVFPRIL